MLVYKKHSGKKVASPECSDCYGKIYQYFLKQSKRTMDELKYRLKKGKQLSMYGGAAVITNDNLTNENAAAFLSKCPRAIKFFDMYPPNWQEVVGASAPPAAQKPVAPPKPVKTGKPVANQVEPEDLDLNQIRRNHLGAKSRNELKKMAKSLEISEEDYQDLDKEALVKLLLDKTA